MTAMSLTEFKNAVRDGGKIFNIEFIKRTTGEHRSMTCRLGVKKGVTGKGMSFKPDEKNLLCVFDMQKDAFRMINLESLIFLKALGKTFSWNTNHECFYEVVN